MIQRRKQHAALRQSAQAIEANGVEPLEDVAVFSMLRGATMLLEETLNLLESGDDALVARRAFALLLGRCEVGKLCGQFVRSEERRVGKECRL